MTDIKADKISDDDKMTMRELVGQSPNNSTETSITNSKTEEIDQNSREGYEQEPEVEQTIHPPTPILSETQINEQKEKATLATQRSKINLEKIKDKDKLDKQTKIKDTVSLQKKIILEKLNNKKKELNLPLRNIDVLLKKKNKIF